MGRPKSGLTSGCSRIATARFFNLVLPAKLAYNEANFAQPQSAEPQALYAKNFLVSLPYKWFNVND
jgi:hypothetical protein